jgi:beta-glucanase (GH16 family)
MRVQRVSLLAFALLVQAGLAADEKPLLLFDGTASGANLLLVPNTPQVTVSPSVNATAQAGVGVTIKPGEEGYPMVTLAAKGGKWDLGAFGHIEARITNTTAVPITVSLRVNNEGNWQEYPWNSENLYLAAGETGTVGVRFGYSWGQPGFKLKPEAINKVDVFTGKVDAERSFRIHSIEAAGTKGEGPLADPKAVRVKPPNGLLYDRTMRLGTIQDPRFTLIKPVLGRWDLRDYLQTEVRLRNTGPAPISPRVKMQSDRGETPVVQSPAIAPGAETTVVVPFFDGKAWIQDQDKAPRFANDAAQNVTIEVDAASDARKLEVLSVKASKPPAPVLPEWLGKRPPVDGKWTKTFEDNFDGPTIDPSKWNIYTENYWDKQSHFSKDNVILGGGLVRLRYQKKRGHENDDPKRKETDYATGFLDGYGKWMQKYGYFEARMKLPTAPGLWPTFWLMPDRGVQAGEQWVRADTGNSGMEFDIMEHLTRWGPNRHNIAHHWDGYGADHKSNGLDQVYVQPDKEGFITSGLLWTPGETVFYCNGKELLRWTNPRISSVQSYMIFTCVSGGWDNSPVDDALLPSDFVIDYVRVWQRADLK